MVDREASSPIRDEMYLFVKAHDGGRPQLTSYLLLAIKIEDENDNLPEFALPQLSFSLFENEEAPQRLGEIVVYDKDLGHPRELSLDAYQGLPRVSDTLQSHLSLLINPSHGLPNLPFSIDSTPDGHFWLNVTRSLDREVEEFFKFSIQAVDYGGANQIKFTVTATVTVSVVDVNDNAPEIIFPQSATAMKHVHTLSYLEIPEYEILSVNAKDKDLGGENGKFLFELGPVISSLPGVQNSKLAKTALDGDLFKLDAVRGLLQTQRRMTEADLGEHWLQLIVRDLGSPPMENRQVLRIGVDRSPAHYAPSNSHHPPQIDYFQPQQHLNPNRAQSPTSSHVVLVAGVTVLLVGLLVCLVLCVCLRHNQWRGKTLPGCFQRRSRSGTAPPTTTMTNRQGDPHLHHTSKVQKHQQPTAGKQRLGDTLPPTPHEESFFVSPAKCLHPPNLSSSVITAGTEKTVFGSLPNGGTRRQIDGGGECAQFVEIHVSTY